MLDPKQKNYVDKLLQKYRGPTHETDFFRDLGLERFIVYEGVLAPEKSMISPLFARFLYEHQELYVNSDVLELGTGSGILAIVMAKYGARKVVATDILDVAVKNAQENSRRYGLDSVLEVRRGDLFEPIEERFDLIIFNYPFFFGKPIEGDTISIAVLDEGQIIRRFLSEAPHHLRLKGRLITAFAEIARGDNDPKIHAEEYGLDIRELIAFDTDTGKKFIYELVSKT